MQWPRFYSTNGYEFAAYQPQVSSWPGNKMEGRFVVAIRASGTTEETYGVAFFKARTDIDKVNRLVTLEDFEISKVTFPTHTSKERQYRNMLRSFLGSAVRVIPLDHLEAILSVSSDIVEAKAQEIKNSPPQIFFSTVPSVLVLIDGPPVLQDLTNNFQRVINTRNILLLDKEPSGQNYFLFADKRWFTAPAISGPWAASSNLPAGIDGALSAAMATREVDPLYPKDTNAPPVQNVFVSTTPAELLQTAGAPNMQSIPGTSLLYVANSGNAIFYYINNSNYYVLISGRWFESPSLNGPWAFVQPGRLPDDFKKIPPDSEMSNVLMSVPGTPEAREAVIANSIPQTATIQRDKATLHVDYYDSPDFQAITGTSLYYAVNSATPVIMVSPGNYYACQGGVWFVSAAAEGPWVVATSVPPVVYTIPAACPIHYVTYAYVYGYTPTVVYVGYTPGYMGTVVAPGGVVVYGTGYYYPPYIYGAAWVPYPPTYGYGASFAMGAAVGFSFGFCTACCCEPYWGCYHWSASYSYSYTHCNVNACNFYTHWGTTVHATGSYGYNAYTGNEWASRSASTFNPYTGAHGSMSSGAAFNPYSGNAAAARSGSWYNPSTGRYASGQTSVAGNAYNGNYSRSSSGTVGNTQTGNSASWNNGSMTSDKDGNVYAYNEGDPSQNKSTAQSEHSAQQTGSQRFDNWSRGGGGGWGGFRGGGGFGGFGGGFGGFRR